MSVSEFVSADPTLAKTLWRHLESLQRAGNGTGLAKILEHSFGQRTAGPGDIRISDSAVSRLHAQLGVYAASGDNPPALRIKARIIQQHLTPYLELAVATPRRHNPFQAYIDAINGIAAPVAGYATVYPETLITAAGNSNAPPASCAAPAVPDGSVPAPALAQMVDQAKTGANAGELRYESLRKSELDAWHAIYGAMKDFRSLKELWSSSLEELRRERAELEQQLTNAAAQIQSGDSERAQLRTQLDEERRRSIGVRRPAAAPRSVAKRARRSVTLPRREAFLQQLASEIGRVRRHRRPLTVALIGLGGLDDLAIRFGEGTEAAVLRCYTDVILAGFRTYDFVATYDRHRFAILFPETGLDGAARALAKAQKRAAETHLSVGANSFVLPAFSSAVLLLGAGEDAVSLVGRLAQTMEEVQLALPDGTGDSPHPVSSGLLPE